MAFTPLAASETVKVAPTVEIGFLEDWPDSSPSESDLDSAASYTAQVRLAFKCTDGKWSAFKHDFKTSDALATAHTFFEGERSWTAVLHNEKVGEVASRPPERYAYYAQIGMHTIDAGAQLPDAGPRTEQFMGWAFFKVRRPLVLVSKPFFQEPQGWTPETFGGAVPERLVELFAESAEIYRTDGQGWKLVPFREVCKPTDLEVCRAYRSRDGKSLVGIRFQGKCAVFESPYCADRAIHWYGTKTDGQTTFLGAEMDLIDMGDFDDNSQSEFVFWHDSYNRNGYVLVWNGFKEKTSFLWSYH
jgi:hypothetical protein